METYIPSQGAEMAALFARQIKGDTAKFDMCDAVAQAVAWFTYNVKRPDGRAPPPRPPDSDSEFSDEDVDDTLPRVKAVAPSTLLHLHSTARVTLFRKWSLERHAWSTRASA